LGKSSFPKAQKSPVISLKDGNVTFEIDALETSALEEIVDNNGRVVVLLVRG
jgi:hypothetical protein